MSRIITILTGLLAAAILATSAIAASPEAMVKGAQGLEDAFLKAFNAQDAEALAACYWNNPEVVLMPPDTLMFKGAAQVKSCFAHMAMTMKGAHLAITESHQIPMGDVVAAWGLFTLSMPGPDGKPMELHGRFTDVKAERDGKWVYLMDHASLPAPPPPPPPMPEGMPKH